MNRLTILFFLSFISANAQVQENFLMERFFMNAFNPAYVGSEGDDVDHVGPAKRSLAVITRTPIRTTTASQMTRYLYRVY